MFDSLELVDFAIRQVNSVLNFPNSQVKVLGESNYRRTLINPAHPKKFFFRLIKMILGLVHASYSLLE